MPWYVAALVVSQPLHFGDDGGMPMKIIRALLDIIILIVLISGRYLWLVRRKVPIEDRLKTRQWSGRFVTAASGTMIKA